MESLIIIILELSTFQAVNGLMAYTSLYSYTFEWSILHHCICVPTLYTVHCWVYAVACSHFILSTVQLLGRTGPVVFVVMLTLPSQVKLDFSQYYCMVLW